MEQRTRVALLAISDPSIALAVQSGLRDLGGWSALLAATADEALAGMVAASPDLAVVSLRPSPARVELEKALARRSIPCLPIGPAPDVSVVELPGVGAAADAPSVIAGIRAALARRGLRVA